MQAVNRKVNNERKYHIPVYTEKESFLSARFIDFYAASYPDAEPGHLNRIEPHSHTYYEIIWVLEGHGVHSIDFKEYEFNGPCVFLLSPRNIHTIRKDCATKGGTIKFSSSFFTAGDGGEICGLTNNVFDDTDVLPVLQLYPECNVLVGKAFDDVLAAYNDEGPFTRPVLQSYLKILLYKIYEVKKHRNIDRSFSNMEFERFRQFQMEVENNFRTHHSVSFYAAALHLSPKTLTNLTIKFTHKTAQQLIGQRLVLEAKRMLYHTSHSVKEIADHLGFDDQAYFNRFFKKHTSLAPNQFRRQYLLQA